MTLVHGPSIVPSGLVFAVDPANTRSYPGSGTSWFDLTGNGNNQLLSNGAGSGPTYNAANGGTLGFSGTYIAGSAATAAAVNINNNITISAWVNQTALVLYGGIAVFGTGSGEQYSLNSDSTYGFSFGTNYPSNWLLTNPTAAAAVTGTWINVAVTFASGTTIWYINGQQNQSVAQGISSLTAVSSAFLGIGGNFPGSLECFNGSMGPILIYNTVLTAAQISQNFNAHRGRYGI
jgi:hypothetical protein